MTCRPVYILVGLLLILAGCATSSPKGNPRDFVKPTVAVMKFENRAAFPMRWDLGSGTRDILVDRLMRTSRYHVIERPELDSVLRELHFQQSGMTRPQDKLALGKIKNVQFLIKGVITDFAQVSGASANASKGSFSIFGSGNRAIVGIIIYVVDVESGEIISSQAFEESVHAGDVSVQAMYKDITFGGSSFYQTPLGEATARVIDRAVANITNSIAAERWSPRIAAIQPNGIILLSGGADRGIKCDQLYTVMQEGAQVFDPQSGDLLGHQPAHAIGSLRVTAVHERYSEAVVANHTAPFQVGLSCTLIPHPACIP